MPHTDNFLSLHGSPVSNYFNAARAALIEAGATFEVVPTRASQDEAFLANSAMGKIPYLATSQGCVAETIAILEYIEDAGGGRSLYPAAPIDRARARQIMNIVQVYVELPLRSLFPGVFMGGQNSPDAVNEARPIISRAMRALSHLIDPKPYLLGSEISHADLFAFYSFDIGERVMHHCYGESLIDQVAGLRDWDGEMRQRASTRIVLADFASAFSAYLREKGGAWSEP